MSKKGNAQAGRATGWLLTWCVIGAVLLFWAAVAVDFACKVSAHFQGLVEALRAVR
jgi:hypothetical protein